MKPQGRRGEVAAEVLTDFPERFAERRKLHLLAENGTRRPVELKEFRFHKGRVLLKFSGVDDISAAEKLVGAEVQITASERTQLEAGSAYISELVGCEVFEGGRKLGAIAAVEFGAGEAPLLKIDANGRDLLVPFASEYVKRLSTAEKKIELALPAGMLELDAPLSEEEKREQQRDKDASLSRTGANRDAQVLHSAKEKAPRSG